MSRPLLSIVIANYNYGRFLEEAIRSVIVQDIGDKVELIICDAASTDNSVEIIKKYANGLPPNTAYDEWALQPPNHQTTKPSNQLVTWWCSESDGGQSAAFNKGFSHSRGRFLTWLNADDVMLPGTLKKFEAAIERHPKCEWFVGGCLWLSKEMRVIQCRRAAPMSRIQLKAGQVVVWGPSSFFTRRMFESVGGVDERFFYTMDSELWHKFAYVLGARYKVMADYAWGLRLHEDAKMSGQNFDESQRDPNHPRWKKIEQEVEWMMVHYRPKHGMTRLKRILSVHYFRAILSRCDTLRFRGLGYADACKGMGLK